MNAGNVVAAILERIKGLDALDLAPLRAELAKLSAPQAAAAGAEAT